MRLASDVLWVFAALLAFFGIAMWSAWSERGGRDSLASAYLAWLIAGLVAFVGLIVRVW